MTKIGNRLLATALVAMMAMAFIPILGTQTAYAAEKRSINIGSGELRLFCNLESAATVVYGNNGDEWRVIGYDGSGVASASGNMTLLKAGNVGSGRFDNSANKSNAYSTSTLRAAIDGAVNNYSEAEKAAIVKRTLVSGDYAGEETDCIAGEEVKDALMWPLSSQEAKNVHKKIRQLYPNDQLNPNGYFWLRSPGDSYDKVAQYSGSDYFNYQGVSITTGDGVYRPAFNLDLGSILLISNTNGGKISEDGEEFVTVGGASGTKWKLTLRDAGRDSFEVDKDNIKYDGNAAQATVPYSGAVAGENEYISAMITDSAGTVMYYGRIAEASSGNGAFVTIDLGGKFDRSAGDKLYVFNEQCNAGNMTDYSSALIDISDYAINLGFSGKGTTQDPYVISSEEEWEALGYFVEIGRASNNMHFKLNNDISVATMVGSESAPFRGEFDGNGNTLTFSVTTDEEYCAPFRYVEDASFTDLHVDGTIDTSNRYAGGLAAHAAGDITITDCRSSVFINNSGENVEENGGVKLAFNAGFIACAAEGSTVRVVGSVFDGQFMAKTLHRFAGFVTGDGGYSVSVTDCIYEPIKAYLYDRYNTYNNPFSAPVYASYSGSNFYFTQMGGPTNGAQGYKVTPPDTYGKKAFGTVSTSYAVSGIDVFKGRNDGLWYKGGFITQKDTDLPIGMSRHTYEVSAGTLDEADDGYILHMPAEDVTITAIHTWQSRVVKATPSKDGKTFEKCSECDKTRNEKKIAKPSVFKLSKTKYVYNGKACKPTVTITDTDGKTIASSNYTVSYSANTNVGKAKATVKFKGDRYEASKSLTFTINKAANPLAMKAKTATVKYSKVQKKAQTLAVTKVIKFTKNAKDKKAYTLSSAKKGKKSFKKYFKINKSSGKVTVKKGLPKGTYKVKVKVKAKGNANYKASAVKAVTFTVKVK